MQFDAVAAVKIALAALAVYCYEIATAIEPSQAVWVMAIAGSLLGIAIGQDRSLRVMFVHAVLGILAGVAASQMIDAFAHAPRPAAALFCGLFATRATLWAAEKIEAEGFGWLLPKLFGKSGKGGDK